MGQGGKRLDPGVNWISLNADGLRDEELFEVSAGLHARKAYGALVVSSNRSKSELDGVALSHGWIYVGSGCAKGSKRGAGFLLSPKAQADWADAGRKVVFASDRNVALRMKMFADGEETVLVIASYFPHSGYKDLAVEAHYEELDLILARRRSGEGVLIGADTNADVGRCRDRESARAAAVGPNGLRTRTKRGDKLVSWCLQRNLMIPRTFFRKVSTRAPTYFDIGTQKPHSNDQFILSKSLFSKVSDAGRTFSLVRSDHMPILLRLRRTGHFARRSDQRQEQRRPRYNYKSLTGDGEEVQERRAVFHAAFERIVKVMKRENMSVTADAMLADTKVRSETGEFDVGVVRPALDEEDRSEESANWNLFCCELGVQPDGQGPVKEPATGLPRSSYATCAAALEADGQGPVKESAIGLTRSPYATCAAALEATVAECVPLAGRRQPGWFDMAQDDILASSNRRNVAQSFYVSLHRDDARKEPARRELRARRKEVARTVDGAKNNWICARCSQLNGDSDACGGHEAYWTACKELLNGLQKPTASKALRMRKPDGDLAIDDAENLSVLAPFYEKLYNRPSSFDPTVIDELPARDVIDALSRFPSDEAILKAFQKLKSGKSGGNGLPADAWKLAASSEGGFLEIKAFLLDFWESELAPEEWVTLQLAVLPKKGDLSDPSNTRGIALMEAIPKLTGIIITGMLNEYVVLPGPDFAYQCGFVPERGCPDGQMPVKLGLTKRNQNDLDSYVLFVDLVKAFDSVDRVALDAVLEKLGVPLKLRNVIMALHSNVKIEIKLGDDKVSFSNKMGVVQGGSLSPTLFIIFVHAFVKTLDTSKWALPVYYTNDDDVLSGRSMFFKGGERFESPYSFYADDSGFGFCSRADFDIGAVVIRGHYARWGLEMHVGTAKKESKTVAMFFPGCTRMYGDGDTSKLVFDDGSFVHFVTEFKYLGSYIHYSLRDDYDIEKRIEAASKMFGALRGCIFSKETVSYQAKRTAYVSIVLPTLLYGAETWAVSSGSLRKLQSFHNRCVRSMCRVNLWKTREFHLKTESLLDRLGMRSLDFYLHRRIIKWVGHVARMPLDRLPRKFLTAWVHGPRGKNQPKLHYGTHITKCLKNIGVFDDWYTRAQDRDDWRAVVRGIKL